MQYSSLARKSSINSFVIETDTYMMTCTMTMASPSFLYGSLLDNVEEALLEPKLSLTIVTYTLQLHASRNFLQPRSSAGLRETYMQLVANVQTALLRWTEVFIDTGTHMFSTDQLQHHEQVIELSQSTL